MDNTTKQEILDVFKSAIEAFDHKSAARHEETRVAVKGLANETSGLRSEVKSLTARVESLEASRASNDQRFSGHERALTDGVAEAKRHASDSRDELLSAIGGLGRVVEGLGKDMGEMKTNVDAAVLSALSTHVTRIESAASKLTKTPQVRTAATIGGAFVGSASIAALFELLKHLH